MHTHASKFYKRSSVSYVAFKVNAALDNDVGSDHSRRITTNDLCEENIPESYCHPNPSCGTALEGL